MPSFDRTTNTISRRTAPPFGHGARTLFLVLACVAGCLAGAPSLSVSAPVQPASLTLTLLHDNDLHGHIVPFPYTETGRSNTEEPSRGGAARRATLVRSLRASIHNPTMLIDSGDIFTRGPFWNAYLGIADVEAMNAVGYELAAIGNNEFKAFDGVDRENAAGSQEALDQVVKRSRFPWICANVVDGKKAFLTGVQPYVVRVFQGVRVGFIGFTTPRSSSYPQTKGLTFIDPVDAAREWVPEARKHCDVLVAVTHLGVDDDQVLAAKTSGIDAIVGGDSHTFLYKAIDTKNTDGVAVPIVQDGEFGVDLGRFDLHFSRGEGGAWHLSAYEYELLPIGPTLASASDVEKAIAPYVAPFDQIVGRLSSIGKSPSDRQRQTTRAIVDAMRAETGADYALNPSGAGLFASFHQIAVTRRDIFAAMPFHNDVVIATLSGRQLKGLIDHVPGLVVAGKPDEIDPDKTYKVALVDFIAHSTAGIPATAIQDTGQDVRDVTMAYLGKRR
ncbi:MAG: bifunctional UDP-sugar hydrolase/5'-nucleotidase [Capsulimonadaceae bacterium]|nr:bifunctional UDP-sugar hydrolase/5'-nucleotidase [Capsulimonadaceae bacterium]